MNPKLTIKFLWAKKNVENNKEKWLPLLTHLTDTMLVIDYLYNNWLDQAQRNIIETEISHQQATQLIKFIGFFHDFGKATPAFQTKSSYQHNQNLDSHLLNQLIHQGLSNLNQFDKDTQLRLKSPHALAGESLLINAGLNESIGAIFGGHHGIPARKFFNAKDQIIDYYSNYYQIDINQNPKIINNWKSIYQGLTNYGLKQTGYQSLSNVPTVTQTQAVILEGLLIMADWLASSEYLNNNPKSPLFPLIDLNQNFDDINELKRFDNAIQAWHVNDQWKPQPINNIDKLFKDRWGFIPNSTQSKMLNQIKKIKDPGLIIIESGCGTGKTEIALAGTEILANKTSHNQLSISLPTQATSNAMYDRVENWLESIAKDDHDQLALKLIHGKAKLNQHQQSLPKASNINNQSGVVVNQWFDGKKSILTEFTVSTIDQLLTMSLKQRHIFLKHLALSGKIVIIDEIHAYDTYMDSYLTKTLRWLGAYHVPVIALSATLPTEKRQEFLKTYARGKYHQRPKKCSQPQDNQYPLISWTDGPQINQFSDFSKTSNQRVKINRLNDDNELLIKTIQEKLQNGGIAGIIVNTVKKAQELATLLKDQPTLILHSAFIATDRAKIEQKIQQKIGKKAKRPQKLIIIGTQVLSQSLDIDFDVLFTDLAPMDSLIQRIGRLHRHKISRPTKLKNPEVYLLGANQFGHYNPASEAIYQRYYLFKTDYFLPDTINLPADTANLVQNVYSPKTDDQIPDINDAKDAKNTLINVEKQKAKAYQIDAPKKNDTLHGWLDALYHDSDTNETLAQAAVRDIKPTIEVILLKQTNTGEIETVTTQQNIKNLTDQQISEETIRLPNNATPNLKKVVDKLANQTKELFPSWQQSSWLKYNYAIVLNKNNQANIPGTNQIIQYNSQIGLTHWQIKN